MFFGHIFGHTLRRMMPQEFDELCIRQRCATIREQCDNQPRIVRIDRHVHRILHRDALERDATRLDEQFRNRCLVETAGDAEGTMTESCRVDARVAQQATDDLDVAVTTGLAQGMVLAGGWVDVSTVEQPIYCVQVSAFGGLAQVPPRPTRVGRDGRDGTHQRVKDALVFGVGDEGRALARPHHDVVKAFAFRTHLDVEADDAK